MRAVEKGKILKKELRGYEQMASGTYFFTLSPHINEGRYIADRLKSDFTRAALVVFSLSRNDGIVTCTATAYRKKH